MAYLIKRYSNRKLYDLQQSRYVTLDALERMVREGKDLSVVDAKTGADLTSITLVQILLERERTRRGMLPPALLHRMVRHGEAWRDPAQKPFGYGVEGATLTHEVEALKEKLRGLEQKLAESGER
jgi:polyhydroxyalkanoate synthesis repressor PhaR